MTGSLVPVSKVPSRNYGCINYCISEYHTYQLQPLQFQHKYLQQSSHGKLNFTRRLLIGPLICCDKLRPVAALESNAPDPIQQGSENLKGDKNFKQWNSLSAKFAGASNIPFLLLQLPQIILNARNLLAGNKTALFAVPWLVLLHFLKRDVHWITWEFIFAIILHKERENEVVVVQTLGVVSIYIVITQLAMAGAMPLPHYIATSTVVFSGLILNFMNYFYLLNPGIWRLWEDFITIAGLSALPQVMWSTFLPYVPNTILPGLLAFVIAVMAVLMARMGKLSDRGIKFIGSISGWTATLLFMWMPVAQAWTNLRNPENIRGLSSVSMLLAMVGNGLMIPRALFIRDLMWAELGHRSAKSITWYSSVTTRKEKGAFLFTGSSWASVFYGWGNLLCLNYFQCISREFFWAATIGFVAWIGMTLWKDTQVYGYTSPLTSLKELVFGH